MPTTKIRSITWMTSKPIERLDRLRIDRIVLATTKKNPLVVAAVENPVEMVRRLLRFVSLAMIDSSA
jgi:hypothetical protein